MSYLPQLHTLGPKKVPKIPLSENSKFLKFEMPKKKPQKNQKNAIFGGIQLGFIESTPKWTILGKKMTISIFFLKKGHYLGTLGHSEGIRSCYWFVLSKIIPWVVVSGGQCSTCQCWCPGWPRTQWPCWTRPGTSRSGSRRTP